jgi:hypothetical protein
MIEYLRPIHLQQAPDGGLANARFEIFGEYEERQIACWEKIND